MSLFIFDFHVQVPRGNIVEFHFTKNGIDNETTRGPSHTHHHDTVAYTTVTNPSRGRKHPDMADEE